MAALMSSAALYDPNKVYTVYVDMGTRNRRQDKRIQVVLGDHEASTVRQKMTIVAADIGYSLDAFDFGWKTAVCCHLLIHLI